MSCNPGKAYRILVLDPIGEEHDVRKMRFGQQFRVPTTENFFGFHTSVLPVRILKPLLEMLPTTPDSAEQVPVAVQILFRSSLVPME